MDLLEEMVGDIDPDVLQCVSRLTIIRSSGHIEFSTRECIFTYVGNTSSHEMQYFVRNTLRSGPNPKADALEKLLGKFQSDLDKEFRNFLKINDYKLKLNALVDMRNRISHGENEGVDRRAALQYATMAIEIGDEILLIFSVQTVGG